MPWGGGLLFLIVKYNYNEVFCRFRTMLTHRSDLCWPTIPVMLTHPLLEQYYQGILLPVFIYSGMPACRQIGWPTCLPEIILSWFLKLVSFRHVDPPHQNRLISSLDLFRDVDPPSQAIIVRSFLMSFALKKIKKSNGTKTDSNGTIKTNFTT